MKNFLSFVLEIVKITVITLAIVLPVRYFLVQPFFVRGASMEPSFDNGQYLVIDELSYRLGEPKRGDVVVFRYPVDPKQFFIKRIIGLPEETVEISGGRVKIFNQERPAGFVLDESGYLPPTNTVGDLKKSLGGREYFVLGDNRQVSSDSRVWGALPAVNLVGRAWLRIWPFNAAAIFAAPQYGS